MPKAEAGTPKAIANAIKAKGLQKLRWFCQMCQKQCRDENGFKCHTMSEGHQRMMLVFAENPTAFMDQFSTDFEKGYLDLLSRRFGTRRVNANQVYNEYIQDRLHVHMNATIWSTLGDFVKYLGRTGKAVVEEEEEGWMIRWINRDPVAIKRAEAAARKEAETMDEDARLDAEVRAKIEAARAALATEDGAGEVRDVLAPQYTGLLRGSADADGAGGESGPIKVSLSGALAKKTIAAPVVHRSALAEADEDGAGAAPAEAAPRADASASASGRSRWGPQAASATADGATAGAKRPRDETWESGDRAAGAPRAAAPSAGARVLGTLDALLRETEAAKSRAAPPPRSDHESRRADDAAERTWICRDLVVKVLSKVDGARHYKLKGVIEAVERVQVGGTTIPVATVRMLESGAVLKIGQDDLETVIPNPPGLVLIVDGRYRGEEAEISSINVDKYCVDARLVTGPDKGKLIRDLDYESVCRLHIP